MKKFYILFFIFNLSVQAAESKEERKTETAFEMFEIFSKSEFMKFAIEALDYDRVDELLSDVEKLNSEQYQEYINMIKEKYDELREKAFQLKREGFKEAYDYVMESQYPILHKIRRLITGKKLKIIAKP